MIPLTILSGFYYYTSKNSLFNNVYKELKWSSGGITTAIEEHFADTGRNLLIASKNTAFNMYYLDPGHRSKWTGEQQRLLRYLRSLYPEMIDEACFIDQSGQEISRIVFDRIALEKELSSEEDRASFFKEAFQMNEGAVLQDTPVISEDTKRWVLPNATPIIVNGEKAAILHFEVTMTYFQSLLKRFVNPTRGYAFILNDRGEFMAHTLLNLSETGAFPAAVTADTPVALRDIYKRMTLGESGIEEFTAGGKDYYMIFASVKSGYIKGKNNNRWNVGYVIPGDRIYVEVAMIRNNVLTVAITFALVAILAYIAGNHVTAPLRELAIATGKLAAGEMPRLDIKRDDELGRLSRSFNVMVEAIKRRDEALRDLAITDGLTGLYNQRHFKSELEREVKAALRFNRPLSLIFADVDYFKHYNDRNGHTQGDLALKRIAEVFAKGTRDVDIAARYGGEEFVVILPQTDAVGALKVAERLCRLVREETIPFEEDQPNKDLTISVGVATFPDAATDALSLIKAADKAAYKAKEQGRNNVATAAPLIGKDEAG